MKTSCSMFSQLLRLFPRSEFESAVRRTGAEYGAKGFSSWSQLVSMLFCQLGRAHSLREIEGGLKSCEGKLAHLGIEPPARSSLSYANAHRPWQLFEAVLDARLAGTNRFPGFDYRVILITEPRATYTFTPVANRTGGPPSFRLSAAPAKPDGHYFVCKPLTATTFDCGEQVKVPFAP